MRIGYSTLNTVPSKSAAALNVFQMCNALNEFNRVVAYLPLKPWRIATYRSSMENFGHANFEIRRLLDAPRCPFIYNKLLARSVILDAIDLVYCRKLSTVDKILRIGKPAILEIHSLYDFVKGKYSPSILENPLLLRIVVINSFLKNDLLSYLMARYQVDISKKILVEHDAVNMSMFESAEPVAEFNNRVSVGYFGFVSSTKGVGLLLEVARKLDGVEFHFFGRVDNKEDFGSVPDNVIFHGYVPHTLIPGLMKSMKVLLLPNPPSMILEKGDDIGTYTSPMKLFEYMAAQVPIVASDVPAIREVLTFDSSILVPYSGVDEWVKAIRLLVDDVGVRLALSSKAFSKVNDHSFRARSLRVLGGLQYDW